MQKTPCCYKLKPFWVLLACRSWLALRSVVRVVGAAAEMAGPCPAGLSILARAKIGAATGTRARLLPACLSAHRLPGRESGDGIGGLGPASVFAGLDRPAVLGATVRPMRPRPASGLHPGVADALGSVVGTAPGSDALELARRLGTARVCATLGLPRGLSRLGNLVRANLEELPLRSCPRHKGRGGKGPACRVGWAMHRRCRVACHMGNPAIGEDLGASLVTSGKHLSRLGCNIFTQKVYLTLHAGAGAGAAPSHRPAGTETSWLIPDAASVTKVPASLAGCAASWLEPRSRHDVQVLVAEAIGAAWLTW